MKTCICSLEVKLQERPILYGKFVSAQNLGVFLHTHIWPFTFATQAGEQNLLSNVEVDLLRAWILWPLVGNSGAALNPILAQFLVLGPGEGTPATIHAMHESIRKWICLKAALQGWG